MGLSKHNRFQFGFLRIKEFSHPQEPSLLQNKSQTTSLRFVSYVRGRMHKQRRNQDDAEKSVRVDISKRSLGKHGAFNGLYNCTWRQNRSQSLF